MRPNHEIIGYITELACEKYKVKWQRIFAHEWEMTLNEKCARKTAIYFMWQYLSPDLTMETMQCNHSDIRLATAFYQINKNNLLSIEQNIDNYLKQAA